MMYEIDGMRQEDYSKDYVMHTGKSDLRFLREEDESGRAMVMTDDERVRPGG